MKASIVAGFILAVGGLFLILRPPHYASRERVFKIAGVQASVRHEKTLPGWVGGGVLGAGIVLLAAGLVKRR